MRSLIIIILFCCTIACNHQVENSACVSDCSSASVLISPDSVVAGDAFSIELTDINVDATVRAFLSNSYSTQEMLLTSRDGTSASWNISPNKSGANSILITCCDHVIRRQALFVRSGDPHGRIETYAGPKTLYTSDSESAMLVFAVLDKQGNPTKMSLPRASQMSNGNLSAIEIEEVESFYSAPIRTTTDAGKHIIGVAAGLSNSVEESIVVGPSFPESFNLNFRELLNFSDSRYRFLVVTDRIEDEYGNVVPDGTLVTVEIDNQSGDHRSFSSPTINGSAQFYIQNPERPGTWLLTGKIGSTTLTDQYTLAFESAVVSIDYIFDIETESLVVGPVIAYHGGTISDGSMVTVQLNYTSETVTRECQLIGGMGRLSLVRDEIADLRSIEMECSGKIVTVNIDNQLTE